MQTLLVGGRGYVADFVAAAAPLRGFTPVFITRTPREGDIPLGEALPLNCPLLLTAPPTPEGDPYLAAYGPALAAGRPWVGYLSSTGVYGNVPGGVATEQSPTQPATTRGQQRLAAEQAVRALGDNIYTFRLAGIYGPGRNMLEHILKGDDLSRFSGGERVSRIHVADIVSAVFASLARPHVKGIFNLADDLPCPTAEVIAYAATLLQKPVPALGQGAGTGRIVSNRRLKTVLGVKLTYPTYKAGLALK